MHSISGDNNLAPFHFLRKETRLRRLKNLTYFMTAYIIENLLKAMAYRTAVCWLPVYGGHNTPKPLVLKEKNLFGWLSPSELFF